MGGLWPGANKTLFTETGQVSRGQWPSFVDPDVDVVEGFQAEGRCDQFRALGRWLGQPRSAEVGRGPGRLRSPLLGVSVGWWTQCC